LEVEELRPRLWRWTAQDVVSFALVEEDELVLFDPVVPADEEKRFWRALDGDVQHHGPPKILLTAQRLARGAQPIVERYADARVLEAGDDLPAGIEARPAGDPEEFVFWIPSHRSLVAGDVLVGTADGGVRTRGNRNALLPLLDLPVELVLLTHGEPVRAAAHAVLAAALR
jgi:glyoxylase-like metal-dependent hydrolase (beta-lactamase superfamily II)